MIQKKLTHKFYGLLGGAFYRTRYKDFNGEWRNRLYDSRYNITIEAGYKPNHKWEFGMLWIMFGGMPYTPFDDDASRKLGRGVLNINKTNCERFSDHNCLSVRVDRRFHFKGSNLILFFSIWNVFNKDTPNYYWWVETSNSKALNRGFPRIPVLGLEFEF